MAIKRLMDITMNLPLFLLLWLLPATGARYLSGGATETPPGFTATDGISPVPTEAPGLNGIPKELRKRAIQTFLTSPPSNWCGFFDGDYQNILSCAPNTPCMLKSNFYIACGCTSRNTDLCFTDFHTTCVDFDIYNALSTVRSSTAACANSYVPYCQTFTASGLTSFGCDNTRFPGTHSFMPVSAYYASYSKNPPIIPSRPVKFSKLSTPARAGIGIGAGLAILIAAVAIAFCLWQKRKRERASSPAGGAGPAMAKTNNIPQGYQSAAQLVQQYQPQSDNTKFPEPRDIPPYSPAPVYTNDSQRMSTTPITPYDLTNNPNTTSKFLNPTIATAPPLLPNPSHQTHQQQSTAPSWDYPPASPISIVGPGGGSNVHQPETLLGHPELGVGEAGVSRTGTPWNHSELGVGSHHPGPPGNHSELGTGVYHPNPPEIYSELPGAGKAESYYPGPPKNHSELGP